MKELQSQISLTQSLKADNALQASDYQTRLATLQTLQSQCREEAGELRLLLETKERELSRLLTSLKVAAAQIAALDGQSGTRSPSLVSQEVCLLTF